VVASVVALLMVAQNWKRLRGLFRCRPLNRRDTGDEEATVDDTRALGRRTRTRADTSVSPRRHKPRLNLGYVCIVVDGLTIIRQAIELGFLGSSQHGRISGSANGAVAPA
jgi:hypothetical protein